MDCPRRSAHLSPDASNNAQPSQTWAPAFGGSSQTSSTTTTSHPSPTNDEESEQRNNTSQSPHQFRHPPHLSTSSSTSQPHLKAPLPSPSASDIDSIFARSHSHLNPCQSSHPQNQSQEQQQAALHPPANHNPQSPHHNSFSRDIDTPSQPGVLPSNFLAEAARRAGMACLARDLGDVSL